MNNVYKMSFNVDTLRTMEPRFVFGFTSIASTLIIQHKRELIQMIEYIEFHMDSYYETSRLFIFGISPLFLYSNKGNWELREKRKTNKQTISDLFGTPFKVEGIMQR